MSYQEKILFHRTDKDGFLYKFFEKLEFNQESFNDLINCIHSYRRSIGGLNTVSRGSAGALYEIGVLFHTILSDVATGKSKVENFSVTDLFEKWEELNFAIMDFFDDCERM